MQWKLDGYYSAHDRVIWLCPLHWGVAHSASVREGKSVVVELARVPGQPKLVELAA